MDEDYHLKTDRKVIESSGLAFYGIDDISYEIDRRVNLSIKPESRVSHVIKTRMGLICIFASLRFGVPVDCIVEGEKYSFIFETKSDAELVHGFICELKVGVDNLIERCILFDHYCGAMFVSGLEHSRSFDPEYGVWGFSLSNG